jgi:hypothetical protein
MNPNHRDDRRYDTCFLKWYSDSMSSEQDHELFIDGR